MKLFPSPLSELKDMQSLFMASCIHRRKINLPSFLEFSMALRRPEPTSYDQAMDWLERSVKKYNDAEEIVKKTSESYLSAMKGIIENAPQNIVEADKRLKESRNVLLKKLEMVTSALSDAGFPALAMQIEREVKEGLE